MDKIYFGGNIMQRALFKPWYDLNQFSLGLYKESSQSLLGHGLKLTSLRSIGFGKLN
jgi:hypothetical protein